MMRFDNFNKIYLVCKKDVRQFEESSGLIFLQQMHLFFVQFSQNNKLFMYEHISVYAFHCQSSNDMPMGW